MGLLLKSSKQGLFHLSGHHRVWAVSYTHLDVYKRQVLYHHVRERLYFVNEQNMQHLSIILDGVRTISIGLGTLTVAAGANSPALTLTTVPADATDRQLVFTSSDVTKATVNSAGVVHGVAAGSAVITAKLASDNTIQATRNVTVTA